MNEEKQQNSGQIKKCSKCQEDVQKNAKKCKHCGSDLRNWFMKHKIISLILIFFIFSIINSDSNNDNNKSSGLQSNQSVKENILNTTDYEIAGEEDISHAYAKRYSITVIVNNNPVTKKQIEAISEKIVNDYKAKNTDALAVFFYFDKNQIDGVYTLAKAEWAPNGDWSQADLKKDQILTYEYTDFIDKERIDGPTSLEREINKVMRDKWYELSDKTNDPVTDEDVAKILAPQYDKTIEEMLEIRKRVSSYDLGL